MPAPRVPPAVSIITRQVPAVTAGLAGLIALLALLGWWLDQPLLTRWWPGMPAMAPNTAVALGLAAFALWLQRDVGQAPLAASPRRALARLMAVMVFLFGAIKLGEYAFRVDSGFGNFFYRVPASAITPASPARMAPHTAFAFVLLGPALLLLGATTRRYWRPSPWVAMVPGLVGLASMVGHWYGAIFALSDYGLLDRMALNTAAAFALLSAGVLCVRPEERPVALLRDRGAAGRSLRRLLPVALLVPLLLGWMAEVGARSGIWGAALGDALVALLSSLLLAGFIWQSARTTYTGEERLRLAHAALEGEVQARTAELTAANARLRADALARETAERELAYSEARFRAAFAHAAIGMALTDLAGRYLQVNDAYCRITGYSADELRERDFGALSHPDDMPAKRALIQRMLAGEIPSFVIEKRYLNKGGDIVWVNNSISLIRDAQGQPLNIIALSEDITARRRVEAELQESEARFRTLADNIPQLAWMTDETGAIVWYNQRWFDYTGTTFEEMRGWGWKAVHHPEHIERVTEKYRHHLSSGTAWEDTFPLRSHTGEYRWFLSRATPIHDEDGRVLRWFGTNTDITEQRQAEQTIREAKEQAEEANRLKDEFLATLSHELRTPLNAIIGWAHLLRGSGNDGPEQDAETLTTGLEVIERNAKAQVQLIEDLLDVSRIITGKLRLDVRPVDLEEIVRAALISVRPAAEARGVRLQPMLNPRAGPVNGDPDRLQQIVWNLLTNAIKFTPRGGRVQVRLERVESHVEIVVADTGAGIAPEFLPFLFDRFRQADSSTTRRHGGLGLGLAIVRHLAEMHGGNVEATSPGLNQGTTLTVWLPLLIVHQPARRISGGGSGSGEPGRKTAAGDDRRISSGPSPTTPRAPLSPADPELPDDAARGDNGAAADGKLVEAGFAVVAAAGAAAEVPEAIPAEPGAPFTPVIPLSKTGLTRRLAPFLANHRLDGLRVLAVDDERDALDLLNAVLNRAGARVLLAHSAAEAFAYFAPDTSPERRPEVLISDIGMPREDGYSLIARLRALGHARGGDLPAIALTAHARAEDRLRALAAGFDIQAAKPIDPAELVLIVARQAERLRAKGNSNSQDH